MPGIITRPEHTQTLTDLRALFVSGRPLLDVRAPVEYLKGSFPRAVNLPILNDEERHRVGLCYKQHGPKAAMALGHRKVSGAVREQRLQGWIEFARKHPDGCLYCFRGGQRSKIAQEWMAQAGVVYPRVAGGYKAMRQFLLDSMQDVAANCRFTVLGGLTGSGKTELLVQLANGVDLEGHANHRGSSFGRQLAGQPCQVDFDNALSIDLLQRTSKSLQPIVLEDESRYIGSCSLPITLYQRMRQAPIVWLDEPLEDRVDRILNEYVVNLFIQLRAVHDLVGAWAALRTQLQQGMLRIAKRLGQDRLNKALALLDDALQQHQELDQPQGHRAWIRFLLLAYYDPMYLSQHQDRAHLVVFRGNRQAVSQYLANQ